MVFACGLDQAPFCCGFKEAGDLYAGDDITDMPNYYEYYSGNIIQSDTAEGLVSELIGPDQANGRPVLFNFVQYKDYKGDFPNEYQANELREYIASRTDVLHIGTYLNPSSGNRVDSYVLKPTAPNE